MKRKMYTLICLALIVMALGFALSFRASSEVCEVDSVEISASIVMPMDNTWWDSAYGLSQPVHNNLDEMIATADAVAVVKATDNR